MGHFYRHEYGHRLWRTELIETAHLPRLNTIKDEDMKTLAEFFGVKRREDFLNL